MHRGDKAACGVCAVAAVAGLPRANSLDLLVIDGPAFGPQKLADLAVAVAAILFSQPDQGQTQVILALRDRLIAQGAAGNSENLTGPPLGWPEPLASLNDGGS